MVGPSKLSFSRVLICGQALVVRNDSDQATGFFLAELQREALTRGDNRPYGSERVGRMVTIVFELLILSNLLFKREMALYNYQHHRHRGLRARSTALNKRSGCDSGTAQVCLRDSHRRSAVAAADRPNPPRM